MTTVLERLDEIADLGLPYGFRGTAVGNETHRLYCMHFGLGYEGERDSKRVYPELILTPGTGNPFEKYKHPCLTYLKALSSLTLRRIRPEIFATPRGFNFDLLDIHAIQTNDVTHYFLLPFKEDMRPEFR